MPAFFRAKETFFSGSNIGTVQLGSFFRAPFLLPENRSELIKRSLSGYCGRGLHLLFEPCYLSSM